MAGLQLRVLGDLEVIRDDVVLDLPPSRKTRGLLAYLALNQRTLRREQLCELLWEIPDDPRGSLRWSLSKIRKLVDDENRPRIIADRSTVAFDIKDMEIDVLALHDVAERAASAGTEELQRVARTNGGAFLEGLDLPDFHDFHTWCIGERERSSRSQATVLAELVGRLANDPAQAVEYAQALVALKPFDEAARADLIRLLVQLDRQQEAEHHYKVGREKLAEVGAADSGLMREALKATPRERTPPARDTETVATAPSPAPRQPTQQERALVGRDEELALLETHIANLGQNKRAHMLLLRGDPGIGKSALLQVAAALARRHGAGLFKATAFESEMIRPFGVWADALRRGLPGNNPANRLLRGTEEMSREQVFHCLVEVFEVEAQKSPVVVICDDVQWADESSFTAARYIMTNNPKQPLLFVLASRDTELRENAGAAEVLRNLRADGMLEEIFLSPLSEQQVEELIQRNVPGADAAALSRECGGNPLLALELARAGLDGGSSLAELVHERLARLAEDARAVLQWAAVLAPRIDVPRLEQVSGLAQEQINDALEHAELQGILHPGERGFRFSHELVRRSIYDAMSPTRQRAMHRKLAELLEVDAGVDLDLAADLSHHARLSGDPLLAGKAMVSAGQLCLRFYANDDAMALYHEGMAFAQQLTDAQRVCLTLELGEIRMNAESTDDWQSMVDEFVALAEQAMDHGSRPHARLGYQMASYLRWLHGELRSARRFSMQAERISRGTTDEAQILGISEAAKCLALLERDIPQADAMLMEASALSERTGVECTAIPLTRGMLHYFEGKFEAAIDCLEDARALAKTEGDRVSEYMANEYLTTVEMQRLDCEAALRHARNLVDIGERMREGSEKPYAAALQAVCHYKLKDDDAELDPALDALRMADAKQRLAFVLNRAAMVHLGKGQLQRAADCAREALQMARIMERPSAMLEASTTLERVHREAPDIESESHMGDIAQHMNSDVPDWLRQRCEQLLANEIAEGQEN